MSYLPIENRTRAAGKADTPLEHNLAFVLEQLAVTQAIDFRPSKLTEMSSSSSNSRGLKPALKLTPPSNTNARNMHLQLPPSDFSALVTAAIKARPSPRRNCPDFYFCDTERAPVAPPPTPRMDASGPSSAVSAGDEKHMDAVAGEVEEMTLTPSSESCGRSSSDSRRSFESRRVRFE